MGRRVGIAGVTLGVSVVLGMLALPGTGSAQHVGFVCNGAGTLRIDNITTEPIWTVEGEGRCLDAALGPDTEPRHLTFEGTGTSNPFTCRPGLTGLPTIVTTGLRIDVTATHTGTASGDTIVEEQVWSGPITLNRLATPTLVVEPGVGASVAFHRIFLACGNDGRKPSATFDWVSVAPN